MFFDHLSEKAQMKAAGPFEWPEGKRAALSLCFDDARLSQADQGLPILDKYDVKASFYVSIPEMKERLELWRQAAANWHEIGNHTVSHPCSGNFTWSRQNALENYTLDMMEKELLEANATIEKLVRVKPCTFAYPGGQTFVGRGIDTKSYIPLVARHFLVGRGGFDEVANDPYFCDLAQVTGIMCDGLEFEKLKELIDNAIVEGHWLILCGHEVGQGGRQTTSADSLKALCAYVRSFDHELWVETVAAVGKYILQKRTADEV